jgi:hypothetical protein
MAARRLQLSLPLRRFGLACRRFPSAAAWQGLVQELRRHGDHWSVWIDWYDDVLAGTPRSEAEEAAFTAALPAPSKTLLVKAVAWDWSRHRPCARLVIA